MYDQLASWDNLLLAYRRASKGKRGQPGVAAFEHFVKRALRCSGYLRYVDDFVLFAPDKQTLWEWKSALEERLAQLRLTIHPGSHPRPVSEGIPFLGFILYPQHRGLKRRKVVYFRHRLGQLMAGYRAGVVPAQGVTASVDGWVNHARYGNTVGLCKVLLRDYLRDVARNIIPTVTERPL